METLRILLFIMLTFAFTASARNLDEQPVEAESPVAPKETNPVAAEVTASARKLDEQPVEAESPVASTETNPVAAEGGHAMTFFMHDILGGSNPSTRAVTGVVNNPAINGQVPFSKPNGAVLPVNNGVSQNNNNNLPFLTGLGGTTANVIQNNNNGNNNNNFPASINGGQLPTGSALGQLMFGTITVIDDELTQGHELGSPLVGKAQGYYVASSIDGNSQAMAFTAMFHSGHYEDSLNFFGVHRAGVSESQLAVMGGTGKYVNAKGHAVVKTIPPAAGNLQHETDGFQTLLEFTVYVTY
ncbi:Dirigent protein 25 [Linum grandiflorum]